MVHHFGSEFLFISTSWEQEQCRVVADFLFSIFQAHVISFLYLFKCIQYVQIGPKFNISQCPPWYFPCLSHHHLFFSFYNSFLMGLIALHPPLLPSVYLKHKRESTHHRVSQILLLSSQNLSSLAKIFRMTWETLYDLSLCDCSSSYVFWFIAFQTPQGQPHLRAFRWALPSAWNTISSASVIASSSMSSRSVFKCPILTKSSLVPCISHSFFPS